MLIVAYSKSIIKSFLRSKLTCYKQRLEKQCAPFLRDAYAGYCVNVIAACQASPLQVRWRPSCPVLPRIVVVRTGFEAGASTSENPPAFRKGKQVVLSIWVPGGIACKVTIYTTGLSSITILFVVYLK